MDSKELRIGNWVHNPIQNIDFQVDGSTIGIEYSRELATKDHKGFDSIPLTEEWLIRFGFEEKGRNDEKYWYKDNFKCEYLDSYVYVILNNVEYQIQNVNGLQNLYFALTGEELTIKD